VDQDELQQRAAEVEHLRRPAVADALPFAGPMLRERSLAGLASSIGNRRFARTVARMGDGDGILSGGLVHPDVEAAIASASGRGRPLDPAIAEQAGSTLGDSFTDVRVHHDDHAAALNRAVSARAFAVGGDIFFGAGEYRPDTAGGRELLTHELAHVVQQRSAPRSGPLTVSQPGDALELDADAAARRAD
jgi:hypothetical protein